MSVDKYNTEAEAITRLDEHYRALHKDCGEVLRRSFEYDQDNSLAEAHSYVFDLEEWLSVLGDRTEISLIKRGVKEYQFSIFSLVKGTYRHAFMALRLHMEITLNAIYLSGYEKRLRDWKRGALDTKWYKLNDSSDGLLSKSFAKSFNKFLQDDVESYRRLADKVYRECSRYVHGNPDTSIEIPSSISFSANAYEEWIDKSDTIREIVMFCLCVRYLRDFSEHDFAALSDGIYNYLDHVDSVTRQLP